MSLTYLLGIASIIAIAIAWPSDGGKTMRYVFVAILALILATKI